MIWGSDSAVGAFASHLKLTLTGARGYLGVLSIDIGSYWSSTTGVATSNLLRFDNSTSSIISFFRGNGLSVRCIKD